MTGESVLSPADQATPSGNRPLLDVRHLVQEFAVRDRSGMRSGVVKAVSDVSFTVRRGETLGLVGETGSGKSTIARSVLASPRPKSGEVLLDGTDLLLLDRKDLREARRGLQMVFQDPYASLDPKWKVSDVVAEPLVNYGLVKNGAERRRRVSEVLDLVGLDPAVFGDRRPRQLSGGQCQRVAIARAIVQSPSLVVCDEAVSSLDVLVQAQVLNLFERLRAELKLSYLFIAHDLALVKQVSDRVAVMYLGKLAEIGPSEAMYREPRHPYTAALISSIPNPDPKRSSDGQVPAISGDPPSPVDPPSGCRFRTRCPRAEDLCSQQEPAMRELAPAHFVACHFPLDATTTDDRAPGPSVDGATR